MKNLNQFLLVIAVILGISYTQKGLTHGAYVNYQETKAIKIQAIYDGGKPIINGQVTVYNPVEPATPWLTGNTDENGEFVFIPDYSVTGNWQVRVRQAGHGTITTIPISTTITQALDKEDRININTLAHADNVKSGSVNNAGYTIEQKLIMAASGVWGCIGTALYFSKKKAQE
jgi:nickel transport protein